MVEKKDLEISSLDSLISFNRLLAWVMLGATVPAAAYLLFVIGAWALLLPCLVIFEVAGGVRKNSLLAKQRDELRRDRDETAEELARVRRLLKERVELAGDRQPRPERLGRCESCGGELARMGPARFVCLHCETSEIADQRDPDLIAGIHLDDPTVTAQIKELQKHLADLIHQRWNLKESAEFKPLDTIVVGFLCLMLLMGVGNLITYIFILGELDPEIIIGIPAFMAILITLLLWIYSSSKKKKQSLRMRLEQIARQERVMKAALQARERMLERK
jgi:hypothetical protein